MKKLVLYVISAFAAIAILYFFLKPQIQHMTLDGREFCLNYYYETPEDIPKNWYKVQSDSYDTNGEFYFSTDEKFTQASDSLCQKFICMIYINDGYLKKIFLVPKNGYQRLFLNNYDSLYTVTITDDFKPTEFVHKNGSIIYLRNGESGSVEITLDKQ